MGASLAKVVLGPIWAQRLPAASRALFAHMAITAKDDGKPPVYFGGRDLLVLSVYGDLAPEGTATRADQYRYVSRLLRPIRTAGGIIPVTRPGTGTRAVYELRVLGSVDDSSTQLVDDSSTHSMVNSSTQNTGLGARFVPDRVDELTIPRKKEEPLLKQDLAEDPASVGLSAYYAERAKLDERTGDRVA